MMSGTIVKPDNEIKGRSLNYEAIKLPDFPTPFQDRRLEFSKDNEGLNEFPSLPVKLEESFRRSSSWALQFWLCPSENKSWQNASASFCSPRVEFVNDALETDDSEESRRESGDPAHQQHRKNDERRNASEIRDVLFLADIF